MSESIYAKRLVGDIPVLVPSRWGGASTAPFESLNLASHVGDVDAAVSANLRAIITEIGAEKISITSAEHGTRVLKVSSDAINPPCDALVTSTPGLALLALAADCVPIALVDPVNRVVGVVHAGWKGVALNVVASAVEEFVRAGGRADTSTAVIGPSICADCYEVGEDRVEEMRAACPDAVRDARHLDLVSGVVTQLRRERISSEVIAGCTQEEENLFSYRGADSQATGRGGIVVVIPRNPIVENQSYLELNA